MLFDDVVREDETPSRNAEAQFAFLNRSARRKFGEVRTVLEGWFANYPRAERRALAGHFRSKNDINHRSAFFELFLHELLSRLECDVTVHPEVPGPGTRRPDFLAASRSGELTYVEAVLAAEESRKDAAGRARINVVYDIVNELKSRDFFVGVEIDDLPRVSPPATDIRAFLAEHLRTVDRGALREALESRGHDALPRWRYHREDWHIDFFPIPKANTNRDTAADRAIGMQFEGAQWVDSSGRIRRALTGKAGRYGELNEPYVIAVNALDPSVERMDVVDALFGKEKFVVPIMGGRPGQGKLSRDRNGLWTRKSGPRNTRVSAVLVAAPVLPWSVPRATVRLYHNPWAERPYDKELTQLPQAVPKDGEVAFLPGRSLAEVFDLPHDWPGE